MADDVRESLLPEDKEANDIAQAVSQRDIRALAFYLLYALDQFDYDISLSAVADNFRRGFSIDIPEDSKAFIIAQGAADHRDEFDEMVKPLLKNWTLERLGCCTRLLLRMALWELEQSDAIPSVVINEAIELSKAFCEKDAYRFINGVLDEIVKQRESDATAVR